MVTEGAFGKLKRRWRVLSKKCESNPEILKKFGLASIVLHNICIEMGDYYSTKHWLEYRSQYQQMWVVQQMIFNMPFYLQISKNITQQRDI